MKAEMMSFVCIAAVCAMAFADEPTAHALDTAEDGAGLWDGKDGVRDFAAETVSATGGDAYKVYLVDARDESMRVRACFDMMAIS